MDKYILIGSGGHAISILGINENEITNNIVGYSSLKEIENTTLKYLGNDIDIIENYRPDDFKLILGLSYLGKSVDLGLRKNILEYFHNYKFQKIISRSSIISENVIVGDGVIIFNGAIINSFTNIGSNSVINTGSIVEHDCIIGSNVQISPGCTICGNVEIGDNSFIGAGTVIRDSVKIAADVIIGMGSVVVDNVNESGIYFGNPLKKVLCKK